MVSIQHSACHQSSMAILGSTHLLAVARSHEGPLKGTFPEGSPFGLHLCNPFTGVVYSEVPRKHQTLSFLDRG